MTISEEEGREAEDQLRGYFLEAAQAEPATGHHKVALLRWARAVGNPLFVLDERIDPHDATPRVKWSDCAPLEST